jgi:O-antigen ligase
MIMLWHVFSRQVTGVLPRVLTAASVVTLCACVTLQFIRVRLPGESARFGFYDNPHHLGLFASLALVLLAWTAMRLDGWRRALTAPWVLAATYLLWHSGSRISWVVFFSSLLLAALLFLPRRRVAAVLGGVLAASAAGAWFSGFASIGARIGDLRAHFWSDERWEVWPATLRLLGENTLWEWLFGHGIGNFRLERIRVSAADDLQTYAFPHNAALQLIYENGIVGLVIVFGGTAALFWALWRSRRRPLEAPTGYASAVLFALLAVVTGHCLLTKSVYSKFTLYLASLVIGASLVRLENAGVLKPWKTRWKRFES